MSGSKPGRAALALGGVAAVLASSCCLGPLLLVLLGFSGAWIGNLAVLEPLRPYLLIVAVVALGVAGWRIFRPVPSCSADEVCAKPTVRTGYRLLFWFVALLVLTAFVYPYLVPYFY